MTANKHTSGPWHHEVTNSAHTSYVVVSADGLANGSTVVIGQCAGPDRLDNARLIAAAPELLEFIKHAADHIEAGIQEYAESPEEPPQPASKWDYDAGQLVGELRRLIAKATGGAA